MKRLAAIFVLFLGLGDQVVAGTAAEAVAAARADAAKLDQAVARDVGYLSLYNIPQAELVESLQALAFQANQLSTAPEIVDLTLVRPDLVRVVRAEFNWRAEVWERMSTIEPYFSALGERSEYGHKNDAGQWITTEVRVEPTADRLELSRLTGSAVPIVRADWWFAITSRQLSLTNQETGVGYYDWLGVKDRTTFEALARLRPGDSIAIGKEIRAAVDESGVASLNRQIFRVQGPAGDSWTTLDTDNDQGDGNAIRNLRRGDYKHKAEEHFLRLPNGLYAYLLCDAEGALQPTAPDFIGADRKSTSNDARIHVGVSCVRCHVEGIRPINDWVRRTIVDETKLNIADFKVAIEIKRQYLSNLERQREKDVEAFAEAVKDCNNLTPGDNAKVYSHFYARYVDVPRDLKLAAAELGTTPEVLEGVLRKTPNLDPLLGGLLKSPIKTSQWEELYPVAVATLKGATK